MRKQITAPAGHPSRGANAARPYRTPSGKDVPLMPADLLRLDEDALLLRKGQLIQTSKEHSGGMWVFGTVIYDEVTDRPPIGVDGMSTQAGWFPRIDGVYTTHPTVEQLDKMKARMGEGALKELDPPPTWSKMKDPLKAEMNVVTDSDEKSKVVTAFKRTLNRSGVQVVGVERIQNPAMWQSFAIKRQTILQREKDDAHKHVSNSSRFELTLFHGTDEETVPKIVTQGFNRNFCGKNATMYGKGVYFARDAEYSARTQYAHPNSKGIQHMFVCRVVVGVYCIGRQNALTPDVRQGHQLYDTTVNNMNDPEIYVTYHDAQARISLTRMAGPPWLCFPWA